MSTLDLGKSQDEIEAPVLMPEEWYPFEITKDPEVKPNAMMGENPEDPKAGHNWVVNLVTIDAAEPEFNGRRFTLWLGVPKPADNDLYTGNGQKIYDSKMERIIDFVENFGGSVDGAEVALKEGLRGQCYVLQGIGQSGDVENKIDIFNSGYKPYEGEGGGAVPGDEVPY